MSDGTPSSPYRRRLEYLAPAESAFFHVLTELVKAEYFVCPKVALTDLFFVARPNENVQYGNKLLRKNIDFLLLRHENLKPVLGIELDYPKQTDHRPVDSFLEGLFASTGLPLIHVTVKQPYDLGNLKRQIKSAIRKNMDTAPTQNDYSPICPRCGITMVLRFDKDGPLNGHKYYGCLNFPACQETVQVE